MFNGTTPNLPLSKLSGPQEMTTVLFSCLDPKPVRYFKNISRVHLLLTASPATTLVPATISSHLDHCNNLLAGLWASTLAL